MGSRCGKDAGPPGLPDDDHVSDTGSSKPSPPRPLLSEKSGASHNLPHQSYGIGRAQFIEHAHGTLDSQYEIGKKTGEGTQGIVFLAKRKSDHAVRAVKQVLKSTMRGSEVQVFKKECEIMKSMDHPNIIKLYDTFEDRKNYYLVMELCTGGELLDKILAQGHLKETHAAVIVQQVLRAVFYMHENSIAHRDLKPENFLLAHDGPIAEDNLLKLIDFGIAVECKPGQMLSELCGTPFYVAPQVVTKRYDKRCDIWSVGVIMYTLLSGSVPFNGTDSEIIQKARAGIVHYKDDSWSHVSSDAQNLVKAMLTRNADKRMSAQDALQHKWIVEKAPAAREGRLPMDLLDRLNSFRQKNIVKKAALQIVAGEMNDTELQQLRQVFVSLDDNSDGKLTVKELTDGITKAGLEVPPDFDEILRGIDADGSGIVDYTEFLAATLDRRKHLTEQSCRQAFDKFDKNGDGRIKAAEITQVLAGGHLHWQRQYAKAAEEVISKYGANDELEFKDFFAMMTDCTSFIHPEGIPSSPSKRALPDIGFTEEEASSNDGAAVPSANAAAAAS